MKINIISYNNHHSLAQDCEVISYCLKKFYPKKKLYFQFYNFQEASSSVADVNIFVGLVSNVFFKYAPINILIIDPHKFDQVWLPYLPKFDHILCKTDFGKMLLREKYSKIQILGWKTLDRYENIEKDYKSFLLVAGVSPYRQISTILELWKEEYPKLVILCGKNYLKNFQIQKVEQENIQYIEEYYNEEKFNKILNQYGIHICLASASSYSNTLQNALGSKSIPIAIDNVLNRTFITHQVSGFLVKCKKKKKLKVSFGSEYLLDREDFTQVIEKIIQLDDITLEEIAEKGKKDFRLADRNFEKNFKEFFDGIWKDHKTKEPLKPMYQKFDEDLPKVTIITPTYQRKNFFKLAIRNYQKVDYPRDKLEWIIVEDSLDESVEDILPPDKNIKYYKLEETKTIGYKRNFACEKASHDIIVCMDDDDYYQPGNIKYRVACLEHLQKDVVACTSMGILDINKIISNMSVSSFIQEYYTRSYESSFGFRKSFWLNHKFSDTNIHEGEGLLKGNLKHFEEIIYQPIMVSLKHYGNTNRRITMKGETNGCHFNFSDELFELITSLDEDDETVDKNKSKLNKVIKNKDLKNNE